MNPIKHFIKTDIKSHNRVTYCKKCGEAIGYDLNVLFGNPDNIPTLKKHMHIVQTKKYDEICDDCYEKK